MNTMILSIKLKMDFVIHFHSTLAKLFFGINKKPRKAQRNSVFEQFKVGLVSARTPNSKLMKNLRNFLEVFRIKMKTTVLCFVSLQELPEYDKPVQQHNVSCQRWQLFPAPSLQQPWKTSTAGTL